MAVLPIGFCRGAYQAGIVPFENSSHASRVGGLTRKRRGTKRRKGRALLRPAAPGAAHPFDFCRPMSEVEMTLIARHRQPRVGSFGDRI